MAGDCRYLTLRQKWGCAFEKRYRLDILAVIMEDEDDRTIAMHGRDQITDSLLENGFWHHFTCTKAIVLRIDVKCHLERQTLTYIAKIGYVFSVHIFFVLFDDEVVHLLYFLAIFPANRSPPAFSNHQVIVLPSLEINGTPDTFLFLP